MLCCLSTSLSGVMELAICLAAVKGPEIHSHVYNLVSVGCRTATLLPREPTKTWKRSCMPW